MTLTSALAIATYGYISDAVAETVNLTLLEPLQFKLQETELHLKLEED